MPLTKLELWEGNTRTVKWKRRMQRVTNLLVELDTRRSEDIELNKLFVDCKGM